MENTDRNKSPKNGGVGIFIGIAVILILIVGVINGEDNPKNQPTGIPFLPTPTTQITQKPMTQTPLKEEPKKIEIKKRNISMKSDIVKNIDDTYRYFFTIFNKDNKELKGYIRIELIKKEGVSPQQDLKINDTPIFPNSGKALFIDTWVGPNDLTGEYKYKIFDEKGRDVVAEGNGQISSKFERL